MKKLRKDDEFPLVVEEWGWKFHHIGIPTKNKMSDEKYLPLFKFFVSGFEKSPFGIGWMHNNNNSKYKNYPQQC